MSPDPFVGAARAQIVAHLLTEFQEVQAGAGSRLVVLSGPPGWGKTRIVQELYRSLAATQADPGYWPEAIVTEPADPRGGFEALKSSRRVVAPRDPVVPEGAAMEWLWWGINCRLGPSGEPASALFDEETASQLYRHAEWLLEPKEGRLRKGVKAGGRVFDVSAALLGVLGIFTTVVAPPVGIGLAIAGAVKAGVDNRDMLRRLGPGAMSRDDANRMGPTLGSRSGEIAALSEGLGRFSQAYPILVVLDDAHHADAATTAVIGDLLQGAGGARVMVVATGWPGYLDGPAAGLPFVELVQGLAARGSTRLERIDLDDLGDEDIEAIVQAELPEAVPFAAVIAARYGSNVFAIRTALRLPIVQRRAREGRLTEGLLVELPQDLQELFSEHWRLLPEDVQSALSMAASAGGTRYLPDLVAQACEEAKLVSKARERLEEGVSPYVWARVIDPALHAFIEPTLAEVAKERSRELFGREEVEVFAEVIARAAASEEAKDLPATAREELLSQHVALVKAGRCPEGDDAAVSAEALAHINADRYDYRRAIELAERALEWREGSEDGSAAIAVGLSVASWCGEMGDHRKALRVLEVLLPRQSRDLGPRHPEVLTTREAMALQRAQAGDAVGARTELKSLLVERLTVLGPDHPDVLETRNDMACCAGEAGEFSCAVGELEALFSDQERVLGPDHPHVFTTRNNIAWWRGEAGDIAGALAEFEALLVDQRRVLGRDHYQVLVAGSTIAHWRARSGNLQAALSGYQTALSDQAAILGPDHPIVLATRRAVASLHRRGGDLAGARIRYEALLGDEVRVLGADNPECLETRSRMAGCRADSGDVDGALTDLEGVLADRVRVLGAAHLDALRTRHDVAILRGRTGDVDGALAQLHEVLPDMTGALGAEHPETLAVRANLACRRAEAGDPTTARSELQALLIDRTRVLGTDHPDVFETRYSIAQALLMEGQRGEAIVALRSLAVDQARALGPDDPTVLRTHDTLASLQMASGDFVGAMKNRDVVLAGRIRSLGPDHPEVLRARGERAHLRGLSGDLHGALSELHALVPDQIDSLGPDHGDVLITRVLIGDALAALGRIQDERRHLLDLEVDLKRVLGPDHPQTRRAHRRLTELSGS